MNQRVQDTRHTRPGTYRGEGSPSGTTMVGPEPLVDGRRRTGQGEHCSNGSRHYRRQTGLTRRREKRVGDRFIGGDGPCHDEFHTRGLVVTVPTTLDPSVCIRVRGGV